MARKFNGTSDSVDLGTPTVLNIANNAQIALSLWANLTVAIGAGTDADIAGKGFDGSTTSYELKINGTGPTLSFQAFTGGAGHGASFNFSPGSIPTGVWNHYYGDYDSASNWHLYYNGVLKTTTNDAIGPRNNAIRNTIGALWTGAMANFFPGAVAHVAIWSKALTPPEVVQLALGDLPPTIRPGNLLAYWPLAMGYPVLDRGVFNLGRGILTGTTQVPDPPLTTIRQIGLLPGMQYLPILMQPPPPPTLMPQIVL